MSHDTTETQLDELLFLQDRLGKGSDGEIEEALALACRFLDLKIGIVSRIDREQYTVEHFHAPPGALRRKQQFPLARTYCSLTVAANDVVDISHMSRSPYQGHPCFQDFGLETYIGVPLIVSGRRYGTLNFSSPGARGREWTATDRQLLRLLSRMIASSIERNLLGQALERAAQGLQRQNTLLSQFAGRVSHDLKAPIRGVDSLLVLLEDDLPPEVAADMQDLIGSVRGRTAQMVSLIEGLLDWSRGGWGSAAETIDLPQLVDECVSLLAPPPGMAVRADVAVAKMTAPRAPLAQVIRNLVSNAIKHHDRPEGTVTVTVRPLDELIQFEISDDGPGIPARHQERIFAPFTTLNPDVGTGLGLAMVRETVLLYGGTLAVHSEGRGTRFTFTWPKRSARGL